MNKSLKPVIHGQGEDRPSYIRSHRASSLTDHYKIILLSSTSKGFKMGLLKYSKSPNKVDNNN